MQDNWLAQRQLHVVKVGDKIRYLRNPTSPLYKVEYCGPAGNVQIVNQGWRVYEARWHQKRFGLPVKNRYPRWALMAVFETEDEAWAEVMKLCDNAG